MYIFLSLKVVFVLANSVDTDKMKQYAAFHRDIHCLSKYPFKGFQYTKGYTLSFFSERYIVQLFIIG